MVGEPPADTPDCPPEVLELIERFQRHHETYKQVSYNETQVRREFIDPFFAALGWDIDNSAGLAEAYKDVIHEDAIKIGGTTKAPDYCFRIGQTRKFFVEAKKPSVGIVSDPDAAYQLRRYGWTAKLSLSILTDFEEFAVYDCRIGPKKGDKASVARVFFCTFDQYADKWPEITGIFAKDSILKGSFDKYVESNKLKRGTAQIDDDFLKEIESWRESLAKNIALRNEDLSVRELNYAVSKIVDRLIFLRMCEDRGIEPFAQLQTLLNGDKVYRRLLEIFYRADERYNSGLFQFEKEKGRPQAPDELTPNLSIDDKVLKDIIKRVYYPCPYEFSVMPADILGQIYEQFLGKVIRLTKGHRAKIEDKPEVKKAGGVYYTPTYIVEYIVKHTVGKLVEDAKTPKKVGGLSILDPACGSGSFLLGAYQYLMNWHLDYYGSHDPAKLARRKTPPIYKGRGGAWRLTVGEKKRILVNNIYGVDIDAQAVEVTKLSLLLTVLEGESQQTIENQLKLFHERALPDLGNNIKRGNSLIGPDFYENKQLDLLDEDECYRINAFDWNTEFADIMKAGGFQAVIGNPPYIRIHNLVDFYPDEVEHIQARYNTAKFGKIDIYIPFIERGISLLKTTGLLGLIVPNKFFQSDYGGPLRHLLTNDRLLHHIVDFRTLQVFERATTYTCLLFLRRKSPQMVGTYQTTEDHPRRLLSEGRRVRQNLPAPSPAPWNLGYEEHMAIIEKLKRCDLTLEAVASEMITGVKTGANDVFVFDEGKLSAQQEAIATSSAPPLVSPYMKAENIRRYHLTPPSRRVLYPYVLRNARTKLIPASDLKQDHPLVWDYLHENRKLLEGRQKGKLKGPSWYGMSFASSLSMFGNAKILTPTLAPRNRFTFDTGGYVFPQGAGGGTGIIVLAPYAAHYILGLLNSAMLTFFFQAISSRFQGGWYAYEPRYLRRIPIRPIDFDDPQDQRRHDRLAALAEGMLSLHKQLDAAKTPTDKTGIQRQIDATDRQIDQLVYELYELTDDEIEIVEEATA